MLIKTKLDKVNVLVETRGDSLIALTAFQGNINEKHVLFGNYMRSADLEKLFLIPIGFRNGQLSLASELNLEQRDLLSYCEKIEDDLYELIDNEIYDLFLESARIESFFIKDVIFDYNELERNFIVRKRGSLPMLLV